MPEQQVDVLIPTAGRPAALAVTLAGLVGQSYGAFDVIVSDQTEPDSALTAPEVATVMRALQAGGHCVTALPHLPNPMCKFSEQG